MVKYTWYREEHRLDWLFPKLKPVTLLGVGWGVGYPTWNDWRLKVFYRRNLHRRHLHSVRDSFSEGMLRGIGIRNVINTSCPSMWQLDGFMPNPPGPAADVLFTLTDYRRVPARDNRLLEQLARLFPGTLYFFPQGAGDRAYLESLEGCAACRERVEILAPSVPALDRFLLDHGNSLVYVGTRLHGGIFSMQHGVSALIIQVDNRAAEIAKDTGLPVIGAEFDRDIERWLTGQLRFEPVRIPLRNIERWRAYWRDQLG
jgi:polysaccharide pyruvyl transferase WcaK-like protein